MVILHRLLELSASLFSAASRAHHYLKGVMADNSLGHELLALTNTDLSPDGG